MPKKKPIAAPAGTRTHRARKGAQANSSPRLDGDAASKGMLIGYTRVSTIDHNLALQRDALTEAGCGKIFTEQLSGAVTDRPALRDALEFARSGETLIVWKLVRPNSRTMTSSPLRRCWPIPTSAGLKSRIASVSLPPRSTGNPAVRTANTSTI